VELTEGRLRGTDGWALHRADGGRTCCCRATMGRPNLAGVWAAPKKQPKTLVLLYCCIVLQKLSTILASKGDMERLISFGAVAELVVSFNSRRHNNFCWTPACTACGGRTRATAEQVKGRTSQWQTTIAYLISSRDSSIYLNSHIVRIEMSTRVFKQNLRVTYPLNLLTLLHSSPSIGMTNHRP
jgi:hypothetical protein